MEKPDPSLDIKTQKDGKKSSASDKPPQSSVEMSQGEGPSQSTASEKSASVPEPSSLRAGDNSSQSETSFQRLFEQADYDSIAQMLEREELEAPNGIPTSLVYERLLSIYLLQNDFHNAKLLWKRIPASIKSAESELSAIWTVGQKVFQSDFAGIYEALRRPWKSSEKLMNRMLEVTRRRAVELVAKAYESITAANLTTLLGTSDCEETKKAARELNWVVEGDMVFPKTAKVGEDGRKFVSSDAHLGLLTDYVSFLESH